MKTNKKEYIVVESPKGVFKIKVKENIIVRGRPFGLSKKTITKESFLKEEDIAYMQFGSVLVFNSKQDAFEHIDGLVFHKEYKYKNLKAGLGIVVDGSERDEVIVDGMIKDSAVNHFKNKLKKGYYNDNEDFVLTDYTDVDIVKDYIGENHYNTLYSLDLFEEWRGEMIRLKEVVEKPEILTFREFIIGSFIWSHTKKGMVFWNSLSSNKEPEMVELENGTKFEVKSNDGTPFDFKKDVVDKIWIDEVTEITEDMQKAMRGRHQRGFNLRSVPFEKLEDDGITIGEKIKAFRKELGLKQYELAEKLKITPAYLSDLENNKNTASIKTLKKLTEVFECYASDILMF